MSLYVCMHKYVCLVYTHVYMCMCICICTVICMSIYVNAFAAYIYANWMRIYAYVHMHVYSCVFVNAYKYKHTHLIVHAQCHWSMNLRPYYVHSKHMYNHNYTYTCKHAYISMLTNHTYAYTSISKCMHIYIMRTYECASNTHKNLQMNAQQGTSVRANIVRERTKRCMYVYVYVYVYVCRCKCAFIAHQK